MKMQIAGFIPQLKRQKDTALGLDIGTDSVKLVELVREGETIKLGKIDSAKITRVQAGAPEQSQAIKRIIANLVAKNKIGNKEIILGINGQSVFMKFLDILPVNTEKLDKTIKYEAQQQIPFSLDEVEWDAHLFEAFQKEKSSSYRVLLVAVKKDRLSSKTTLVEGSGLRPAILDVSTLSIYNCIRFNRDYDENKLIVALDIGAQSTDLLIIKGDNLWMRSFALGGDNFTEALEKKFGMSFAEAEKLKQGLTAENSDSDIEEAIRPVLENLQSEITRSIEYYYFQQKQIGPQQANDSVSSQEGNRVEEILLSGGTSLMQGLDKLLAQRFSCKVKTVNPFKMLHLDEEIKKKLDSQNKVLFSHVVGLALRGLSKSYISINLLKEQIKVRTLTRQKFAFTVGSAILVLLILFGASTFMHQDYREKSLRLQYLKGLLNVFSANQAQIKELQRKEKLLSRQVDSLYTLALNRALWLEVLSELQKMLPDDLWITDVVGTISFDTARKNLQNKLDLQGKALSYEEVNNFVSKLKFSPLFAEVKPLSSAFIEEQAPLDTKSYLTGQAKDKEKVEVVKFSISMKVKPMHTPGVDIGARSK